MSTAAADERNPTRNNVFVNCSYRILGHLALPPENARYTVTVSSKKVR
jgi:hypothetical protein